MPDGAAAARGVLPQQRLDRPPLLAERGAQLGQRLRRLGRAGAVGARLNQHPAGSHVPAAGRQLQGSVPALGRRRPRVHGRARLQQRAHAAAVAPPSAVHQRGAQRSGLLFPVQDLLERGLQLVHCLRPRQEGHQLRAGLVSGRVLGGSGRRRSHLLVAASSQGRRLVDLILVRLPLYLGNGLLDQCLLTLCALPNFLFLLCLSSSDGLRLLRLRRFGVLPHRGRAPPGALPRAPEGP
mmetsp:Transcript_61334/g.159224  ORF Transcript_61334/g.159224 Transcript_61334/m.159224 type:complete len:238 (+) Transcript_61334:31-744(+)